MERTIFQKNKKLQQIAEKCGVSLSTVYRIQRGRGFQGNPRYAEIQRELLALNNDNFGSLACCTLLMIANPIVTRHELAFYNAARKYCHARKINLLLTDCKKLPGFLRKNKIHGVISLVSHPSLPENLPLVYLNKHSPLGNESSVCVAGEENWFQILHHLKQTGSKRIGIFFANSSNLSAYYETNGAFAKEYLRNIAGLEQEPELYYSCNLTVKTHAQSLIKAANHFLSLKQMPDTLLTNLDIYLPGLAVQLKKHSVCFPRDIRFASVYSYLDSIPSIDEVLRGQAVADWTEIRNLRYVHGAYYFDEMSEQAVETVIEKIRNPQMIPRMIGFSMNIVDDDYSNFKLSTERKA